MAVNIIKSSHTGWDGKKQGNMTQAMVKGEELHDVISIPCNADIKTNDIVWLKSYPSSTVITSMMLERSQYGVTNCEASADVKVTACLLGIDSITKEAFAFKYGDEGGNEEIQDNLFNQLTVEKGTTAPTEYYARNIQYVISKTGDLTSGGKVYLKGDNANTFCFRCEKRVGGNNNVLVANVNKLWKKIRDDETLAMIAEWTMSDLYDTNGNPTGKAAANYDPSAKNGYMEFGIGLVFEAGLDKSALEALQLKVTIKYKDSMVSETSYGKNYIPVQVTY